MTREEMSRKQDDRTRRPRAGEGRKATPERPRQRPGTSFHDLLYGIIAGIALTQFIDFGFWQVNAREPSLLTAWVCLLALYLWGVLKMTVFWLGARDDFLALREVLGHIRVWEYLGGVLVAMLLGLLPLTAVMCASEILKASKGAASEGWQARFLIFLGAHTLATTVSAVSVAAYVIWRLQGKLWTRGSGIARTARLRQAIEPRLLRPKAAVAIPVATSILCWVAWLLSVRFGSALAGLYSVAALIPVGSGIEEILLWHSRRRHRASGKLSVVRHRRSRE